MSPKYLDNMASSSDDEGDAVSNSFPQKQQSKRMKKPSVFDSSEEASEEEQATAEDLAFIADAEGKTNEQNSEEEAAAEEDAESSEGEISPDELSDEDLDLIEENLGKRRGLEGAAGRINHSEGSEGRFKRLRRRAVEDEEDASKASMATESKSLGKSKHLEGLFDDEEEENEGAYEDDGEEEDDLRDFIEDEDELPDTLDGAQAVRFKSKSQPQRRAIIDDAEAPKRALSAALASGQISRRAWEEMMEIFGDGSEYADLVVESDEEYEDNEDAEGGAKSKNQPPSVEVTEQLSNLNVNVLDVLSLDVPERYVSDLKLSEPLEKGFDESWLSVESAWIAKRIQKIRPTDSFSGLCSAVASVIRFIRLHGLEIPFIATYRKEYFLQFFSMNELWTILDEDIRFRSLSALKERIQKSLEDSATSSPLNQLDADFIKGALEEEWDEAQLLLINEYLLRQRRTSATSSSSVKLSKERQRAFLGLAYKIVPSATGYAENLAKQRVVHGPLLLTEAEVEEEAFKVLLDLNDPSIASGESCNSALTAAVQMAMEDYGTHPRIFAFLKDRLLNLATITVTPTSLGQIEISPDPSHYLAGLQYITRKPLSAFIEDQGLALCRGSESNLITLEIEFSPDHNANNGEVERILEQQFGQLLPGLESFRGRVFEGAWRDHWKPRLESLVKQRLRSEAEAWTAQYLQFYFQEELMILPLSCEAMVRVIVPNHARREIQFVELDPQGKVTHFETLRHEAPARPEEVVLSHLQSQKDDFALIVAGQGQETLEVYRCLRDARLRDRIYWGNDDTALLFQTSMQAAREFPETSTTFRYAVGVGRRLLNPVAEFAVLSETELLALSLHPLQGFLPPALRLKHLQRALINVINLLGVPLNDLVVPGYREGMLSYVSGLGPRRAEWLCRRLQKSASSSSKGLAVLSTRSDLIMQLGMSKRIFTNSAAFLKITPDGRSTSKSQSRNAGGKSRNSPPTSISMLPEPLDGTRIHPESYNLARKMAADALEMDTGKDEGENALQRRQEIFGGASDDEESFTKSKSSSRDSNNFSEAIVEILKEPRKLDDLLLEEYAREIERLTHLPKHLTLFDIKSELQGPFPDPRRTSMSSESSLNDPAFFTSSGKILKMLTGREESWWWRGRQVQIKPLNPVNRRLATLLEGHNLVVGLSSPSSDAAGRESLPRPGQAVAAFLDRVDVERLMIDVSLRPRGDLKKTLTEAISFDPFYDFNRAKDLKPTSMTSGDARSQTAQPPTATSRRTLNHPAFRAVGREDAEKLLYSAPIGEVILRPSSQGRSSQDPLPGDLTLTWKVAPGLFAHVPLGELNRPRGHDYMLGRTLLLPALVPGSTSAATKVDKFEDLDEIIARRLEPIISLLQEAQGCPKFFANPALDAVANHLRESQSLHPGRIAYCLSMAPEPNCAHLLLSHLVSDGGGASAIRHELIIVDPRGYALVPPTPDIKLQVFERIDRLVDYFKHHYSSFLPRHSERSSNSAAAAGSSHAVKNDDPRSSKYQQFAN